MHPAVANRPQRISSFARERETERTGQRGGERQGFWRAGSRVKPCKIDGPAAGPQQERRRRWWVVLLLLFSQLLWCMVSRAKNWQTRALNRRKGLECVLCLFAFWEMAPSGRRVHPEKYKFFFRGKRGNITPQARVACVISRGSFSMRWGMRTLLYAFVARDALTFFFFMIPRMSDVFYTGWCITRVPRSFI